MDYSKLSDYEINCRVAHELGLEVENNSTANLTETYCGNNEGGCKFGWSFRDYCNNPAEAWPIIVGSRISLSPFDDFKEGGDYIAAKYKPTRDNSKPAEVEFFCCDKPLRAAMIVYLMMQESE